MKYKLKYNRPINSLVDLLLARGVTQLDKFMMPTEENCLDDLLLDNMEEGYQLYKYHLFNSEMIDLIVDCDVDGYTSSAIFYLASKILNPDIDIRYHLHNGKQHGLEDMIDDLLVESYITFVVCPDSASNDYNFHSQLAEIGVDVMCLDHHEAEYYSPNAVVINNQLSKRYSNKALSGATITYKFVNYCARRMKEDELLDDEDKIQALDDLADLAAVGAIGDMMDVTTLENRYLFDKGLRNIKNFGLQVLIQKQSYSLKDITRLNPIGIAFYIVPLMNALIRVGTLHDKTILFESLINGSKTVQSTKRGAAKGEMETIAEQSARNCVNAKSRQKREEDKALDYLSMKIEMDDLNKNKILFLNVDDPKRVNTTITGLIAMKVQNVYQKPVLLGREDDYGVIKGSIRNNDRSALKDLKSFLEESKLFEYVQGHANAAGFAIKKTNVDKFLEYANEKLADINFNEGVYTVDYISGSSANEIDDVKNLITEFDDGKPFWGQNMEEPTFVIEDIEFSSNSYTILGPRADTIKFNYCGLEIIQFFAKDLIKEVTERETGRITIMGRGSINEFMGNQTPQIIISDYEIQDSILDF